LNTQKPASKDKLYSKLQENFRDIYLVKRCREKYKSLKQTGFVQDFANKLKHMVLFLDLIPFVYKILRQFQNSLWLDIKAKIDEFHRNIKSFDEYIYKADDIN
jgi:hypothetical protein